MNAALCVSIIVAICNGVNAALCVSIIVAICDVVTRHLGRETEARRAEEVRELERLYEAEP